MATMAEIERQLLQTMTPAELQKAVKARLKDGARNRFSALSKLLKEHGQTVLETRDLEGLFLRGFSSSSGSYFYLLTQTGIEKVRIAPETPAPSLKLSTLLPVKVSQVQKLQGSSEDMVWNQTGPETEISHKKDLSRLEVYKWTSRPSQVQSRGKDPMIGKVQYVNDRAEWTGGQKGEAYPIVDPVEARVNLSFQVTDPGTDPGTEMGPLRVGFYSEEDLLQVMSQEDIDWLIQMEQDGQHNEALMELRDMFQKRDLFIYAVADPYYWAPPDHEKSYMAVKIEGRTPPKGKEDWILLEKKIPSCSLFGDSIIFWIDDYLHEVSEEIEEKTAEPSKKAEKASPAASEEQEEEEHSSESPEDPKAPEDPSKAFYQALMEQHGGEDHKFSRGEALEVAKTLGLKASEARDLFKQMIEDGDIIKEGERGPYSMF